MHTTTVRYPEDIWRMLIATCDQDRIAKAQYIREATLTCLGHGQRDARIERLEVLCARLLSRAAQKGRPTLHERAPRYGGPMGGSATTTIEIDTALLNELRAEDPGKPDRELIEDLAKLKVDFGTIRHLQERFDLSEHDAMAVGAEAARAGRRR